jgi:hypothetical protein
MKGARTSCINQEAALTIEKAIGLPDERASDCMSVITVLFYSVCSVLIKKA